ncbi:MAG TPA: M56 family metallopeptidase [Bryobacteraceae bacterium]
MIAHLADISIRSIGLAALAALALLAFGKRAGAALAPALPRLPVRIVPSISDAPAPPLVVSLPGEVAFGLQPRLQPVRIAPQPAKSRDWLAIVTGIYIGVALFLFARLITGSQLIRKLVVKSAAIHPGLLESDAIAVPIAVGWIRPKILLPSSWRNWDNDALDVVLTHERAHIRRRDSLIALLARLNQCLFWFHPLAWWLQRNLSLLAEQACDEVCVAARGDRRRYADLLLEMAARVKSAQGRVYSHALGMASRVHQRIDRVLDERRRTAGRVTGAAWLAILIVGFPAIYATGALRIERLPPLASFEFPRLRAPSPPELIAQQRPPLPPPQQLPTPGPPPPRQVTITVTVTDLQGRYVTGLNASDFRILDDGIGQAITGLSSDPISLAATVNTDGPGLQNLLPALRRLRQGLGANDELLLVYARGERPQVAESIDDLIAIANGARQDRMVWMDASYAALERLKSARNPLKAFFEIGDRAPEAGDDASAHTQTDVDGLVRGTNIALYNLRFDGSDPEALGRFVLDLRTRYSLSYTASPAHGGYHSVEVRVRFINGLPPLRVRTEAGYYAQ